MISDTDFEFINGCIGKFEIASFTNEDYSKFNFPNLLCKVKLLERSGFIVAIIPFYPVKCEVEEPCLYGSIRFYKKGSEFYIQIKGMGKVIRKQSSPNHFNYLSNLIRYPLSGNELILTFYIHEIDYFEVVHKESNFVENSIKFLFKLFNQKPPHYRSKNIHSIHFNWG